MDHLTCANWGTNYNGFGELVGEAQGLPHMQLGVQSDRQFTPHTHHILYPTPPVPGDRYVGESGVFVQEDMQGDVQQGVDEAVLYPETNSNHHPRPNKGDKFIYLQQNLSETLPDPEFYSKNQHRPGKTDKNIYQRQNLEEALPNTDSFSRYQHRPARTEKIMCMECNATFACLANLRNHMRIHTGERPYICEECGASFTQRSNLRSHKRVHTGERPYMCGICGQTFARSSHLPGHMRTHTGERPFKCTECDRSFATNQIMKNHMRTHTGERPFVCEVCEATFAQSSCLATHKKIHTGERNFKCARCGKAFISRSGLQTHERVHTGEKPYKCENCCKSFKTSSYLSKHKQKYCGNSFTSKVRRPDVKKSVRKANGTRKIGKPRKVVKVAGRPPKRNRGKRLKPPRLHSSSEFEMNDTQSRLPSPENIEQQQQHKATNNSAVKSELSILYNTSSKSNTLRQQQEEHITSHHMSSRSNTNHTDLLDILAPPHHLKNPSEEDIVEDLKELKYDLYPREERDPLEDTGSLEDPYNVQGIHTQFQDAPVHPELKDVISHEYSEGNHEFPEGSNNFSEASHEFSEVGICPQGVSEGTMGMHSQSESMLGVHSQPEGILGLQSQTIQVLPPVSSIAMATETPQPQQPSFTTETDPGGWYGRNYM